MVMRVTAGLRPPCPVGISVWLLAASVDPSVGRSHDPLFLAVIDPASGTIETTDLSSIRELCADGPSIRDLFGTFSAYSLAVFDDGFDAALYAGGSFISDGDLTVNRVARGTGAAQTDEGHL